MLKLYKELKRRKVLKTLGVYGATAIVITTTAASLFPYLSLPDEAITFVIVLAILGFPITFFFSWTYDLTQDAKTDDNSEKKYTKIVLPLTGFLTIVGGAFWFWYSLGNITSGSDLDLEMGIKKSIAVFNFDNSSYEKAGDFLCSAIRAKIHSQLTKLGKLDVKSRSISKKDKIKDLDLDYYIEGQLLKTGENKTINISLVSAKSHSIILDNDYKVVDKQISAEVDKILKNILNKLDLDYSENEFIANNTEYGTAENFKLIGEGIFYFDNKNYTAAIKAFNSVLISEPENIAALYHKANSFFELNKYTEAMDIYKDILGQSKEVSHMDWQWSLPQKESINQTLCTNIELIKEDLAIMFLKGVEASHLIGFNPISQIIKWTEPVEDKLVDYPVVINSKVFLTSSRFNMRQKGAPTLYAYDISTGEDVLTKEFPRDENQTVVFKILESYNNISNDTSKILLSFNKIQSNKDNYWELALLDIKNGEVLWMNQKIGVSLRTYTEVMLINTKSTELLLLILNQDVIALNHATGEIAWQEHFPDSDVVKSYDQKIYIDNQTEKYLAIWDPISRKEVYKYSHESNIAYPKDRELSEFHQRHDKDVVLINFRNGDLIAINTDGGFFNWNRKRWTQNIGIAERIWFKKNIFNRVFCLTVDDSLFTINLDSGEIINRFPTNRHDYDIYYDKSQNTMVLKNAEFLIGVDPKDGDQLWKIRDTKVDKIVLIENTVLAVKPVPEDNILIVNNYNRDNGNLIGTEEINISKSLSTLPMVGAICALRLCDYCAGGFNLLPYSNESILINLHDEIIKFHTYKSAENPFQKKDIQLQIARTYAKNGQLESAIKEYQSLIKNDQMNQEAYWDLATIYQEKDDVEEAAKKLVSYYELTLPESPEGIKTVQELKNLDVLKWEKNIYWDQFSHTKIEVDNERIFLFMDNQIKSYRIISSALIWEHSFEDINTSIVHADVNSGGQIYFIKKNIPNVKSFYLKDKLTGKIKDFEAFKKATIYSIAAMDKRNKYEAFDLPIDIPGESEIVWMSVNNNKIFIQSILQNKMFVSTYGISDGKLHWKISRDISNFYTSYNLKPAFYNGNLLLPLETRIEYIDKNGNTSKKYSNQDMETIISFNEKSIQNNTMIFFIEDIDYEYVIVNLETNEKIAGGSLDIESPKRGHLINNMFVDVSSSGRVTAYNFNNNEAAQLWDADYNSSLEVVAGKNNSVYLLDKDNNYILEVSTQSGIKIKKTPLLWPGENVKTSNNYFIVQSENKLYLISI